MRPHSPHAHPELIFYVVFSMLFAAGIYLFIKGFRVYWEFRLLRNIPLTAIRGVAMGLVRVRGRATGDETLTSPVSHQPCYYYRLVVEKWAKDAHDREWWALWMRDSDAVPFYLEDETGKVLVYARGAELDLTRNIQTVIVGELPENLGGRSSEAPTPDQELIRSMALIGSPRDVGRYRLTEHCILGGVPYDVTGTCAANPVPKGESDSNMIKKGLRDATFVISDRTSAGVEMRLDLRAIACIYGGAVLAVVSAVLTVLLAWNS
ncbi:MAG TPA: GIDE domain-containing protein [Terriglobia bacterium]|nr:GIDE domain-containing protein [Terriglobia bacterium]